MAKTWNAKAYDSSCLGQRIVVPYDKALPSNRSQGPYWSWVRRDSETI